jgi:signal transduction histidine kinase
VDIDALLDGVRRVGVSVELDVTGEPARLDPSVNLTAYRIVQEALTNVTRHAGRGSRASVRLAWGGVLQVMVSDDGLGSPADSVRGLSTGRGLRGLRERVAVAGGLMDAGPARHGGWEVSASLPIADRGADVGERAETVVPAVAVADPL